jgi:AcrR family transcriptional regulator
LFVRSGYAETGTPEIVAAAEITRGALYHHFTDKAALFEAVLRDEAKAVFDAIVEATKDIADPMTGLEVGADAYLDAMAVPGRTRLLLVEGPAVLGAEAVAAIDREFPAGSLTEGLSCVVGRAPDAELEAFSSLLSAAFDRAALDIVAGAAPGPYRRLLKQLLGNVPQVLTLDGI